MQSAGVTLLSPAGQALGLGGAGTQALPGESEEARKRRLAALQASQRNIAGSLASGSLSSAGQALANMNL